MTKEKYFQTSLHIFQNIDMHFLRHIFLNPYTFKYPSLNTWHTSNIENLEIEQKLKRSIQQEWQFESSLWINDFDRSMTKRKILDDTFRKRPTLETTIGICHIWNGCENTTLKYIVSENKTLYTNKTYLYNNLYVFRRLIFQKS